jgi:hypothetical protein
MPQDHNLLGLPSLRLAFAIGADLHRIADQRCKLIRGERHLPQGRLGVGAAVIEGVHEQRHDRDDKKKPQWEPRLKGQNADRGLTVPMRRQEWETPAVSVYGLR